MNGIWYRILFGLIIMVWKKSFRQYQKEQRLRICQMNWLWYRIIGRSILFLAVVNAILSREFMLICNMESPWRVIRLIWILWRTRLGIAIFIMATLRTIIQRKLS